MLCTTAEAERDSGSQVVLDADGVVVVCPFWSGTPYEMLVIPDEHQGHLARSDPEVLAAVGGAIKAASLAMLKANVGDLSYNIVIHTLPHHHEDEFHWHVHVLPRCRASVGSNRARACRSTSSPPSSPRPPSSSIERPDGPGDTDQGLDRHRPPPDRVWEELRHIERHVDWMANAETDPVHSKHREGAGHDLRLRDPDRPVPPRGPHGGHRVEDRAVDGGALLGLVTPATPVHAPPGRQHVPATRLTWSERLRFPWWLGGPVGGVVGGRVMKVVWRRNLRRLGRIEG